MGIFAHCQARGCVRGWWDELVQGGSAWGWCASLSPAAYPRRSHVVPAAANTASQCDPSASSARKASPEWHPREVKQMCSLSNPSIDSDLQCDIFIYTAGVFQVQYLLKGMTETPLRKCIGKYPTCSLFPSTSSMSGEEEPTILAHSGQQEKGHWHVLSIILHQYRQQVTDIKGFWTCIVRHSLRSEFGSWGCLCKSPFLHWGKNDGGTHAYIVSDGITETVPDESDILGQDPFQGWYLPVDFLPAPGLIHPCNWCASITWERFMFHRPLWIYPVNTGHLGDELGTLE